MTTMRLAMRARRELGTRLASIAGLFVLLAACNTETANSEACYPGDFEAVTLANGTTELLRCGAEGGAYSPYDGPDPNAIPDANKPDTGACGANGTKLGYFCNGCTTNTDCVSGLDCEPFPNKGGNICTPECTSANASMLCVAPSAGCGNNGHCKP